jgi:hypothetical protein
MGEGREGWAAMQGGARAGLQCACEEENRRQHAVFIAREVNGKFGVCMRWEGRLQCALGGREESGDEAHTRMGRFEMQHVHTRRCTYGGTGTHAVGRACGWMWRVWSTESCYALVVARDGSREAICMQGRE